MPFHKFQLTLDEQTGVLTARHFVREPFTHPETGEKVDVTAWEDVPVDPAVAKDITALIDANRTAMDTRARIGATRHFLAAVDELEKKATAAQKADKSHKSKSKPGGRS